jgi:hypothetical protein
MLVEEIEAVKVAQAEAETARERAVEAALAAYAASEAVAAAEAIVAANPSSKEAKDLQQQLQKAEGRCLSI